MRVMLAWMVEQLCRPLDTKVHAVATVTDDEDAGPRYYLSA